MATKNVLLQAAETIPGFSDIQNRFVRFLTLKDVSKPTLTAYTRTIAQISMYFNQSPLDISEKQLNDYLFMMKSTRSGPTAFKLAIYSLRSLFTACNRKRLKTKLPSIPQPERLPVVLSCLECKQLIKAPVKFRDRFLIAFMYSSGLRLKETVNLRIADIDTQRMQIRVHQGKGRKDRYVPLSKYIAQSLPNYLNKLHPVEYLFNSTKTGKQFSVRGIQRVIRQAIKDSGITKKAGGHTLRHSYATHLLENGVDLITIKNVLGHSRIQTTMGYLHVAQPKINEFKNPLDTLYHFK